MRVGWGGRRGGREGEGVTPRGGCFVEWWGGECWLLRAGETPWGPEEEPGEGEGAGVDLEGGFPVVGLGTTWWVRLSTGQTPAADMTSTI